MSQVKRLAVSDDGSMSGLFAIGFHGQLGPRQTPARREAIFADAKRHFAQILGSAAGSRSERTLTVEIDVTPLPDGDLPGYGTWVGPWPARQGQLVVIVGPQERSRVAMIAAQAAPDEPPRVGTFVAWLGGNDPRSAELTCERVGEALCAWYCSPEESVALWRRVQYVARGELLEAVRHGSVREIEAASFWYSRTALGDEAIYLAAAGLKRAGSPYWEKLLRAGTPKRSDKERSRGLSAAEATLPPAAEAGVPPASAPQRIDPTSRSARDSVRERFIVPRKAA